MNAAQKAAIDRVAGDRAGEWLAGASLPESVQRRIRPLLLARRSQRAKAS